jgi:predicted Zn-dependent protease with MMP-like domain
LHLGRAARLPYNTTMSKDAIADPLAWQPLRPPSLAEMETVAIAIFRRLPAAFREQCADLVIQVDDFATTDVLDRMGIKNPFGLLGLFQGIGLPFRAESMPLQMPNMIWLYRRPILHYWASHDAPLGAVIAHVLVHEIGHHFGFSDDDMEAIEAQADPKGGS